jgi:putative transposase
MTSYPERHQYIAWITEAMSQGARQSKACEVIGLTARTVQRWQNNGEVVADKRPDANRPAPANKLTDDEKEQIIEACNQAEHVDLPPSQIVPILADRAQYIASESSFYRILKEENQLNHRGRSQPSKKKKKPTTHIATGPNQVWSWDITYLPSNVRGQFQYLYLIEDIYSRKIVGWEVHAIESGELAAELIQRAVIAEHCFRSPLVLHSDNGSPMKSFTFQAKLVDLGITTSHRRPRVSNDNAFSESLFRTLKYCPSWPSQGFATLDVARDWVNRFVEWYNNEHCHSSIKFVTPMQRHNGEDKIILEKRDQLYKEAKQKHPERWSGDTRNWTPVGSVTLNPERDEVKEAA